MNIVLEKKRQTYISFFKDGVADGLLHGTMDDDKRSSAYYKQGYDYGLTLHGWLDEKHGEETL